MKLNTAITIHELIYEMISNIDEDIKMLETQFKDSHRTREVIEVLVAERQNLLAVKADFETVTCEV